MRYYSYIEPDENDKPVTITMSEEEIRALYWDSWYTRMCKKFGKEYVDQHYSFKECLQDWIVINWAWEV